MRNMGFAMRLHWSHSEPHSVFASVVRTTSDYEDVPTLRNELDPLGRVIETWFEPVVRRVARALEWQRAEEALVWAESISRAAERERAQIFILKRWRARDEAGAEAWIAESSLSDSARQEIRSAAPSVFKDLAHCLTHVAPIRLT